MLMLWIRKYGKRFCRQPLFIAILVLMPVGSLVFSHMANRKSTAVQVCVGCEPGTLGEKVAGQLLRHEGMIRFVRCDSKSEMKKRIAAGEFQCGYYFPGDMEKRLQEGRSDGMITQYYRRGVWIRSLVMETVFAALFECYGERIAGDYIRQSGFFDTRVITDEMISEIYRDNQMKQDTFQFSYERTEEEKRGLGSYLTAPVMGIIALLIYLAGFCGLILWRRDRNRGLISAVPAGLGRSVLWISIGVPVCLMTVMGAVSWMLCRSAVLPPKEIACMGIYVIMVIAFVGLFAGLRASEGGMWLVSLALVFISAVATPVFINLAAVIPGLRVIGWFCPPAYFLEAVYGGGERMLWMAAAAAVLLAADVFLSWGKRRERAMTSIKLS